MSTLTDRVVNHTGVFPLPTAAPTAAERTADENCKDKDCRDHLGTIAPALKTVTNQIPFIVKQINRSLSSIHIPAKSYCSAILQGMIIKNTFSSEKIGIYSFYGPFVF